MLDFVVEVQMPTVIKWTAGSGGLFGEKKLSFQAFWSLFTFSYFYDAPTSAKELQMN